MLNHQIKRLDVGEGTASVALSCERANERVGGKGRVPDVSVGGFSGRLLPHSSVYLKQSQGWAQLSTPILEGYPHANTLPAAWTPAIIATLVSTRCQRLSSVNTGVVHAISIKLHGHRDGQETAYPSSQKVCRLRRTNTVARGAIVGM